MYNFKSKKAMKFNKLTHLTIVVVLAIIFIVVYLYYTIKDVKKIHNEVQKLTTHITDMNNSITNITSTIIPLLKSSQVQTSDMSQNAQCVYVPEKINTNIVDDDSSVNSQELKTIMETIEDENIEPKPDREMFVNDVANLDDIKDVEEMMSDQDATISNEVPKTLDITKVVHTEQEPDLKSLSVEELKKVSYEQLRKYCKTNLGNNYKGTKDVLIYRIKGITA